MHRYKRYRFLARHKARKLDKKLSRHPLIVPTFVFLFVVFATGMLVIFLNGRRVIASDARVIILNADKKTQTLPSREETVGEFLEKAQITLNEGDVVEPAVDTKIEEDNFHVNVYRATPVIVVDGSTTKRGFSAAKTPRSVAEQMGTQLYAEDNVELLPSTNFIKDGSIGNKIVIERSSPVNLSLYGAPLNTRTHATTVRGLLKEKNVQLAADDNVTPALDTPLTPETKVFVTRNGIQVITIEETIAMPEESVEDRTLSFGTTAVRQVGKAGKKSVTYEIEVRGGVEVARKVIQQVVIEQPVAQIVAKGRAVAISGDKESWMAAAGIAPGDYAYVNYIISRESGWCPTKWQGQIGYCPAYYTDLHPIDSGYGFGLCQSTPAKKMATAGADWQTNPVTQLRWCSNYAVGRYGSWKAAYDTWSVKHWW